MTVHGTTIFNQKQRRIFFKHHKLFHNELRTNLAGGQQVKRMKEIQI